MSTTAGHIHPLIAQFREVLETSDTLTQKQVAEELGVSERTVSYWMTTDTTPQKRYRQVLINWLGERSREQVAP